MDSFLNLGYSKDMKIKNLLFDLDATLYSAKSIISENMTKRILSFCSNYLQLPLEEVREIRRKGLIKYGTTMEWLRTDYNLKNPTEYFEHVHPDSEKNEVPFDENLRPFLKELSKSYHLSVLTNAPKVHANCILNHLNVYDLFDGIYDLEDNNLFGKPYEAAYRKAIEEKGFTVAETIFFDDMPKYVKGYADIGGRGVLVDQDNRYDETVIANYNVYKKISSIYEIPEIL